MEQQPDRSIRVRNIVIGIVVVAAVTVLLLPWSRNKLFGDRSSPAPETAGSAPLSDPGEPGIAPGDDGDGAGLDAEAASPGALLQNWTRSVGSPPVWPGDFSAPPDCDAVDHALAEVCAALDATADPALVTRSGGACNLLKQAGRDLAASPPDVASELRSHQAILSNVFHGFRVLGRKRLQMLRETLDGQRELAEPLGLAFYGWLASREDCEQPASVKLPALYDYAGFVFTSMGGQAYLRRRTPRIESLACFYALQIVDRAHATGRNPQGLDPRPEIRRCLALVRSQEFVFTERYVESLESMAARWRSAGS